MNELFGWPADSLEWRALYPAPQATLVIAITYYAICDRRFAGLIPKTFQAFHLMCIHWISHSAILYSIFGTLAHTPVVIGLGFAFGILSLICGYSMKPSDRKMTVACGWISIFSITVIGILVPEVS